MEEKLKAIVERIEKSQLSESEKNELYVLISEGLQSTVWPIMVKYMPQEDLEYLAADPKSRVTVESYAKLIGDSIKDGEALKEIEETMTGVLENVEKALTDENI
ncbi:hypothetical protein HZB58_05725 [Candidatus Gottesmanbacteria bacterium]|nr:hypothetical protein [Candidatus Gottesmanbacteria bacterium]